LSSTKSKVEIVLERIEVDEFVEDVTKFNTRCRIDIEFKQDVNLRE
jgi:uncharacterized membrane-anchored protein YitT (DUF2179 family)